MSAASAPKEPEVIAELEYGNGHSQFERRHWKPLLRRCDGNLVLVTIIMHLYDELISPHEERKGTPPKFWPATIETMQKWTGASARTVHRAIALGEKKKFIGRESPGNKTTHGGFAVYPENFREAPLPPPPAKREKPAKKASLRTRGLLAAFQNVRVTTATLPKVAESKSALNPFPEGVRPYHVECATLPAVAESEGAPDSAATFPTPADVTGLPQSPPNKPATLPILAPVRIHLLASPVAHSRLPLTEDSAVECPIGLPCPFFVKKEEEERTTTTVVETTTTESPVVVVPPPEPEAEFPENETVLAEMREYGFVTQEDAERLIRDCRARFPDASLPEMVGAIREVARGFNSGTRTRIGVLKTQVPEYFKHYQRPQPPPPAAESPEQRQRWIEMWRATYHAADSTDQEREDARQRLIEKDAWTEGETE